MPATILSDNGASSGTAGLKTSGSNDGILELQTTTAGGTATAAITIDTAQRSKFPTTIGVGGATPATSGSGITFPASASPSSDANTLDDYEEGTWTPVIDSENAGTGRSTTVFSATYTKVGRSVNFQAYCSIPTLGSGGSGNWAIKGLPFTALNSGGNYFPSISVGYFNDLNANVTFITGTPVANTTYIEMRGTTAAAASISGLTFSTYVKANTSLIISGNYFVA